MEANRTTEGTGQGMSITHNLVKLMNGHISVESELNNGSVFTVRLLQQSIGFAVLGKERVNSLQKFEVDISKLLKRTQLIFEPMPYGSVLLVDDVESNIYVAKGLMAPYGMSIDTVMSGLGAIEKIKDGKVYDIVFMDHMMPGMDGIETTEKIRKLGYTQPIIALTANAVVGQSDIFLQNGFDDFIYKPIDVRQLNSILKKFVRDKQPPEVIEAANRDKGIQKRYIADGTVQVPVSPELAEIFVRDASKFAAVLEKMQKKDGVYDDDDIRMYTITAHALKSALANVNEDDLSYAALKLEQAGRAKDTVIMTEDTPAFLTDLKKIIEKLKAHSEDDETGELLVGEESWGYLHEKLPIIKNACEEFDRKTAKDTITELRQRAWPRHVKEMLGTMAEKLLDGDFMEVSSVAEKIIETV
jgi:CheY-like chemotaxis protein